MRNDSVVFVKPSFFLLAKKPETAQLNHYVFIHGFQQKREKGKKRSAHNNQSMIVAVGKQGT